MDFINEKAEKYAAEMSSDDDVLLRKIFDETMASHPQAHLMSSFLQGRFLSFISGLMQPKYVLEIGTFTGFSAMCLAEGLANDGELHTIEMRDEDAKKAKENFTFSKKNNQIHLHLGNAKEIIEKLDRVWDLVFIDADKTGYEAYYEALLPRLSDSGLIIADNVLFHGQVLEDKLPGKNAKAIDAFNRLVAADARTEQVLLTIRDGLLLIKKKK
jgi:caffeoyl-CoA O-methyltransferase